MEISICKSKQKSVILHAIFTAAMKKIMAILNLTPDSFFPGSRLIGPEGRFEAADFVSRVETALAQGADIIDLGACSTRPGSEPVSAEEEWARLQPALALWKTHFRELPLSIDTFRSELALRCADYTDTLIVNDISAGDADEKMLSAVASLGCGYVAMHHTLLSDAPGPDAAQQLVGFTPEENGEVGSLEGGNTPGVEKCPWAVCQLNAWYEAFEQKAEAVGLNDWWFDPGFGFGKTLSQNWTILRHLEQLPHRRPILVGLSRKNMLHKLLKQSSDPASRPETLLLTRLANRLALSGGASVFRVHDPARVF